MELMPTVDEGAVAIHATFRSGNRLEVIDESIAFLEDMVEEAEEVETFEIRIRGDTEKVTAYLAKDRKLSMQ